MSEIKKIILFDGVCNLCNFWVDFIIRRDKKDKFRFAALQSSAGIEMKKKYNINQPKIVTVFLITGNKVYTKSTAALLICKQLSGPIKFLYPLIIFPAFIRNFLYDLIVQNRYKLFGKRDKCRLPEKEEKEKFLA